MLEMGLWGICIFTLSVLTIKVKTSLLIYTCIYLYNCIYVIVYLVITVDTFTRYS